MGPASGIVVKDSANSFLQPNYAKLGPFVTSGVGYGIEPGKSYTESVDLSKHYDLSKPGKYSVYVVHLDHKMNQQLRSNTLVLTITP